MSLDEETRTITTDLVVFGREHPTENGARNVFPSGPVANDGAEDDDAPSGDRVTMHLDSPMNVLVDQSIRLLANDEDVFQKHSELVHVVREEGDRFRPRRLRNSHTRYLLAKHGTWLNSKGVEVHPPGHIANSVLERTAWERVRCLRAVVDFPAIGPEGSLRTDPGYDLTTRTFFTGGVEIDVPENPTQDDACKAAAVLCDITHDFPFSTAEHLAAWMAGLLTPLARYAHDGNAPITLVQANGPRVGKTTLVKLISEIINGTPSPVITFTNNEDETRKRILSLLRVGRTMVLVDNVTGQFGGANINALSTSRAFEDRILGQSLIIEATNDTSWYVTGNNICLAPDTAERCLNVRLQSDMEKPHLRTDFKYPLLFTTVKERRGQLLSAALTVLKAYIVAGQPDQHLPAWGGFEAWSRLVRGAVMYAGMPDPAATRIELEEHSDPETDEKSDLVQGLWEWQASASITTAYRANEVISFARNNAASAPELLRTALEDIAGMPGSLPDAKKLARHLRDAKGRNLHGLRLVCQVDAKNGHRWRVERVAAPAPMTAGIEGV